MEEGIRVFGGRETTSCRRHWVYLERLDMLRKGRGAVRSMNELDEGASLPRATVELSLYELNHLCGICALLTVMMAIILKE